MAVCQALVEFELCLYASYATFYLLRHFLEQSQAQDYARCQIASQMDLILSLQVSQHKERSSLLFICLALYIFTADASWPVHSERLCLLILLGDYIR